VTAEFVRAVVDGEPCERVDRVHARHSSPWLEAQSRNTS
jgi:hypothetical protein